MSLSVFEKLQKIISEQLEIDEDDITPDSDIVDEFQVEIPDEAIEQIATVEDAVKYIEDHE